MPGNPPTQVSCPANVWTKVAEGSFHNVFATYKLTAGAGFKWHWTGTGIPFYQEGSGGVGVVSQVSIPPSTYWRIEVNPSAATIVTVS